VKRGIMDDFTADTSRSLCAQISFGKQDRESAGWPGGRVANAGPGERRAGLCDKLSHAPNQGQSLVEANAHPARALGRDGRNIGAIDGLSTLSRPMPSP